MKAYSIGREMGCDILINDSSDVISRRHAILNVMPSGKMTIVDSSSNGTYVNGIRIAPNVPVPVTRKDNISFAHVARLDWNMIPKPRSITMYVIMAIVAVVFVLGGIFGYHYITPTPEPEPVVPVDTTKKDIKEEPKKDSVETTTVKSKPAEKTTSKEKTKDKSGDKGSEKKGGKGSKDKPKDDSKDKKDSTRVSRGARH